MIFPAACMLNSERFMGIAVFVYGLPGSGKSAAASHIKSFAGKKKSSVHGVLRTTLFCTRCSRMIKRQITRKSVFARHNIWGTKVSMCLTSTYLTKRYKNFTIIFCGARNWLTMVQNFSSSNSHEMIIAKLFPFLPHFGCIVPTSFSSIQIFQHAKHALKREQIIHGLWMIVTSQIIFLKRTTREIISNT